MSDLQALASDLEYDSDAETPLGIGRVLDGHRWVTVATAPEGLPREQRVLLRRVCANCRVVSVTHTRQARLWEIRDGKAVVVTCPNRPNLWTRLREALR